MKRNFTVRDLPAEERPREKLVRSGAHNLSDKELLTTLLGRGIGGESVMITAQRLMGRFRNIGKLANASINDLSEIKGIGIAKATQIKAAFELGKRINGHAKQQKAAPFLKWAG
ncbi:MAG: UPF0758 domain-containing protein, partial [Limisphaerales bacterium]